MHLEIYCSISIVIMISQRWHTSPLPLICYHRIWYCSFTMIRFISAVCTVSSKPIVVVHSIFSLYSIDHKESWYKHQCYCRPLLSRTPLITRFLIVVYATTILKGMSLWDLNLWPLLEIQVLYHCAIWFCKKVVVLIIFIIWHSSLLPHNDSCKATYCSILMHTTMSHSANYIH
jgi:hypothetical protein